VLEQPAAVFVIGSMWKTPEVVNVGNVVDVP
jgi:hypothetical protein